MKTYIRKSVKIGKNKRLIHTYSLDESWPVLIAKILWNIVTFPFTLIWNILVMTVKIILIPFRSLIGKK